MRHLYVCLSLSLSLMSSSTAYARGSSLSGLSDEEFIKYQATTALWEVIPRIDSILRVCPNIKLTDEQKEKYPPSFILAYSATIKFVGTKPTLDKQDEISKKIDKEYINTCYIDEWPPKILVTSARRDLNTQLDKLDRAYEALKPYLEKHERVRSIEDAEKVLGVYPK